MFFVFAFLVVAAMLAMLELGHRYELRQIALGKSEGNSGQGVVEAAVFALLGLILAFSFSAAAGRLDQSRNLSVEEADAIGTAYLRIDLMPKAEQKGMREDFAKYVDTRIAFNRDLAESARGAEADRKTEDLEKSIWARAIAASGEGGGPSRVTGTLLPALNEMFDIVSKRSITTQIHMSSLIVGLIVVLSLLCSFVTGRITGMEGKRNWGHRTVFVLAIATTFWVIADLEYPRRGIIRIDVTDTLLDSQAAKIKADLAHQSE